MKKKSSVIYSSIALAAVAAYCGFLVKGGIEETNRLEETVPYEVSEPSSDIGASEEDQKENPLPVAVVVREASEEASEAAAEKIFSPLLPVAGEVIGLFSDSLVYNSVTGDWRAHSGVDIAAAKTARVLACEDGTVTRAYEDPLWGSVIEIDHGEYLSVCKNLSTLIMVNVGDKVKKGDPISGVGEGAAAEGSLGPHLHFEIRKDGKAVDPTTLLDKSSSLE